MSVPFAKPYAVTRYLPGAYGLDGMWTEGTTEVTVRAVIHPLNPGELAALPEGRRSSQVVKINSEDKLQAPEQATVANGGAATNADILAYNGKLWEVFAVASYNPGIMDHWKAMAAEVKEVARV